jgi:HAD superfamily hydrolase (TIGR01459 family)
MVMSASDPQTPPKPVLISGLRDIAERYDVVLSDVWGVIHNGRERYPLACEALTRFGAEVGPVVLISNAPRPSADVIPQLRELAVPDQAWSAFVSSGDATRAMLAARAPRAAWTIGPDRDAILYEGLGLGFAGPDDADFISCTGPVDDEVETPEDYRSRFELALARGLDMICANPDKVVQRGGKLIYCGGALADLYVEMGGTVHMAGKPHAPIYDLSLTEASRLLGRPVDPARVLCIGDGAPTDVMGANRQGLDVLFIAAGIHAADTVDGAGRMDADRTAQLLAASSVSATYAMMDLDW